MSVHRGDWKLIRLFAQNNDGSDQFELYNLRDDLGETTNLAAAKPELVRELDALITGFLHAAEAVVPICNPAYDPEATKKAAPADELQGWKARNSDASVKVGVVIVKSKSENPFLGVSADVLGPAVVRFRARCADGGQGKVAWIAPGTNEASANSTEFTLRPGNWQTVAVDVPVSGRLGILRIHLPAREQSVEIDWIELKGAGKPRRWDF